MPHEDVQQRPAKQHSDVQVHHILRECVELAWVSPGLESFSSTKFDTTEIFGFRLGLGGTLNCAAGSCGREFFWWSVPFSVFSWPSQGKNKKPVRHFTTNLCVGHVVSLCLWEPWLRVTANGKGQLTRQETRRLYAALLARQVSCLM